MPIVLSLADVVAGEHKLTVVTGAPNIAQGQKVAARLVGRAADRRPLRFGRIKTLKAGDDPRYPPRRGWSAPRRNSGFPTSTRASWSLRRTRRSACRSDISATR